jgi:photosystem II stability/assembly factor-like uncharacterized protein
VAGAAEASVDYRSASFVDAGHGWLAGIDNKTGSTKVLRTTNGGRTYAEVGSSVAAGAGVAWVTFVNRKAGVWGNGSLLRTDDGGASWQAATTAGLGTLVDGDFATTTRGWAACSYGTSEPGGAIGMTTDGGATWTRQVDRPGPDGSGSFSRVSSPSTSRCYVLKWGDQPGVWATKDGGEHWVRRVLPPFTGKFVGYNDIAFPTAKTGWAVGDSGRIVRTKNGGRTWVKQKSRVKSSLIAVDFVSTKVGYAVGERGCALRTRDGGVHWVKLKTRTVKALAAVSFASASRGWMVGSQGVRLRTVNGGKTWKGQH